VIECRDLEVRRDGRAILRLAELRVDRGETLVVRGRNGSGKTTLLRVLAGLEDPDAGTAVVAEAPRERVFVQQAPYVFRGTVAANVGFGLLARGVDRRRRRRLVQEELAALGLAHLATAVARRLSGGEVRRVALARALVLRPRLLLLDEPHADLDAEASLLLSARLEELARDEVTALLTSPVEAPALEGARAVVLAG